MKLLHKIIFWSHLIAGVIAGAVIFLMSATGVILMYEHQLVEYGERDVRNVVPPVGAARLSLDEIVAKAHARNPGARPTGLVMRNQATASVAVGFGREGAVYVDPYNGAVLGRGSKLHDWFHDVIDWHRWLGREGEERATARAITGACNLAFFCHYRSLSLVAAQLALARIEIQPSFQSSPARQSAGLELAQRHRFLVFRRAGRADAHCGGDLISVGQRSSLHVDRQRAAAQSASARSHASGAATPQRGRSERA